MDGLLEQVGSWGRFQVLIIGSLQFGAMSIAWSMMQMAFAGLVPDWWCRAGLYNSSGSIYYGNLSLDNETYQACDIPRSGGKSCAGHVVFDHSVTTVINEWSLICGMAYIKRLMTSVQMGGVLVGAMLGGQSSDTFGRKHTVYVASLLQIITSLVAAFSDNWQMFLVLRVFIGVAMGAYLASFFPYPLEFVTPRYRQLAAFVPGWNVGLSIFAFVAWRTHNWSYLHVGSAICGLPFLLTYFVIPESARWLATKGRLQEAEAVMKYVARINRREKPRDTLHVLKGIQEAELKAGNGRRYTYLDVYRGWKMALCTLTLNFLWCSLSFCYYGISFGVGGLSGNIYLNIFLMTLVEILPNLSTVFLANRFGRRVTCFLFFTLCSVSSFAILIVDKTVDHNKGTITTVLAMISKLSVGAAWQSVNTFTSELYPTVIRTIGYGSSCTSARVGGILAPLLLNMDTAEDVVRGYIIVGCLMAAGGVASLLLRETKGCNLLDSVEQLAEARDTTQTGGVKAPDTQPVDMELGLWSISGNDSGFSNLESAKNQFESERL